MTNVVPCRWLALFRSQIQLIPTKSVCHDLVDNYYNSRPPSSQLPRPSLSIDTVWIGKENPETVQDTSVVLQQVTWVILAFT